MPFQYFAKESTIWPDALVPFYYRPSLSYSYPYCGPMKEFGCRINSPPPRFNRSTASDPPCNFCNTCSWRPYASTMGAPAVSSRPMGCSSPITTLKKVYGADILLKELGFQDHL